MTELIPFSDEDDEFLRRALLLANTPEVMGLQEAAPAFSPHFQRRMARLLADPFHRAKKELRPRWAKVLNTAAMLALVVAVAFTALMMSPTARAWFERVVEEWTGYSIDFTFFGTATGDAGTWAPEYLPEGFEQIKSLEQNGTWTFHYENIEGTEISLKYTSIQQGRSISIDSEHSDFEQIQLNGYPAEVYRSNTPGFPNYLIWISPDEFTWFRLMSTIAPEELIQIAKSITPSP